MNDQAEDNAGKSRCIPISVSSCVWALLPGIVTSFCFVTGGVVGHTPGSSPGTGDCVWPREFAQSVAVYPLWKNEACVWGYDIRLDCR